MKLVRGEIKMIEKENKILKIIVTILIFINGCLLVHVINDKKIDNIDETSNLNVIANENLENLQTSDNTGKINNNKEIGLSKEINTNKEIDVKKISSKKGSYFSYIKNEEVYKEDKNGEYAGWEDELSGLGCGWWCTVQDFVDKASASSTLQSEKHLNYLANNVCDESRKNSWVEGVDGDGIGEYIELTKQYICYEGDTEGGALGEICVVTGYANNEKLWKENNRVKTLLMYIDNEPYAYLELEDTINPQLFNVWENERFELKPSQEIKLKFEIIDVYEGTKYDDTAITYLDVEFMKGH